MFRLRRTGCIMNKCSHCGVQILDETEHCPLCHSVLDDLGQGENAYPNVYHKNKKINFLFRLFLFLAIVLAVIVVAANIMLDAKIWWSAIVVACEGYGMWMFYLFARDHSGYRARILSGIFGAVILIILIDEVMGYNGWSVNYVFPAAMLLTDVALLLLMLINRRNWQSYLIFQIAMVLIGLVAMLFIFLGWITAPTLSVVAFIISVLLFLGSVILGGRTARIELKRRFHI